MGIRRVHRWLVPLIGIATLWGGVAVPAGAAVEKAERTVSPVRECAELVRAYDLPGARTKVEQAAVVPAGAQGPEHCDVQGAIEPAIKFRLKLPTQTYSGRYLQVGCGAYCGVIPDLTFPDCGKQAPGDVAVAGTDNGHVGTGELPFLDTEWAKDNQQARDDFFYRAPHVLSRASKAIIKTFYGQGPRVSYFDGCSMGGREALLLAQRYPYDFDGIISSASAHYMGPGLGSYLAWLAQANLRPDGTAVLSAVKLRVVNAAAIAACDTIDGLEDGILADPRACTWDPVALRCPSGADRPDCLTAAQVTAMRKLYTRPADAHGRVLYPASLPRGGELALIGYGTPDPDNGIDVPFIIPDANAYLENLGYPIGKPHSSVFDYEFTARDFHRLTPEGRKGNAASLDLSKFKRAGGKLLLWSGWSDMAVPAEATVDYYSRLASRNGGLAKTQEWARLFLIPSGHHCLIGGDPQGLNVFQPFDELVSWVERGKAPERIVAAGTDNPWNPGGPVVRTRPVFPYPLVAKYDGSGSIDDERNFVAGKPIVNPKYDQIDWLGEYLSYVPGPVAR
ncbi:tannase/feruloyl esterase family alpha/beta hydrolase [Tenggerimyces flavus]|uniref:Tannase/feruloyl esterase family alpha/beta hydrolase n=1 Tax=Tenggerimyces flavus TaxID=1708749 RepID=A0ABV7YHF8_9ACTN|nr:tannase/feruloyl esterase family alpha/beta hydrolase [Tenggerimyces flavus]MBM7784242.1 feruloyl esterase [Tenggerimyces flavus]